MTLVRNNAGRSAFSLVELLTVITIIAILTAVGGPAFSALISSGSANQNISQLSGILEQAREYAMAQNTYVWVALYSPNSPVGPSTAYPSQVSVAVIASTDGTDPAANANASWQNFPYNTAPLPASGLILVSKIVTLKQINIENVTSTIQPPTLPTLSTAVQDPTNSINDSLSNPNAGYFTIQIPATSGSSRFVPAIEFTPSGQVRNGGSPIDVIDFDLQPKKGGANDTRNVAVLRLNGLTGETIVYR